MQITIERYGHFFPTPDHQNAMAQVKLGLRTIISLRRHGPLLVNKYPGLARHMYETHRRLMIHLSSSEAGPGLDRDVEAILRLARDSLPSGGPEERKARMVRKRCRPQSARRVTC